MNKLTFVTLTLAAFSFCTCYSQSREGKIVKLDKLAVNKRNEGIQLFKLNGSKIEQGSKTVPIKLPADFPGTKENAYFFFQYQATGLELGVVLVADYKSHSPILYFDGNSNLDFTDDGAPVTFKGGNAEISFHNRAQPRGKTTLSFSKIIMDDEKEKKYLEMQKLIRKSPKAEFTLPRYWLSLNPVVRVGHFRLNGTDFTIGLYDENNDGIISRRFKDDEYYTGDRLLLAEGKRDTLIADFTKNGYKIFEDVVSLSRANIKIEEFDSLGTYVRVSLTDQSATVNRLKEGDILQNFTYGLIDNSASRDIYALKGNGKYKLIELWGTWCRGCVQILPELSSLHAELGDRLDIVSLNFGDKNFEKVAKFIKDRGMTWHQGYSTLELNRKLGVQMFPYSILLDENFRIIALQTEPSFVRQYITNTAARVE